MDESTGNIANFFKTEIEHLVNPVEYDEESASKKPDESRLDAQSRQQAPQKINQKLR